MRPSRGQCNSSSNCQCKLNNKLRATKSNSNPGNNSQLATKTFVTSTAFFVYNANVPSTK